MTLTKTNGDILNDLVRLANTFWTYFGWAHEIQVPLGSWNANSLSYNTQILKLNFIKD